jgi:allantoicase
VSDFRELVDLASERLGGSVLYANDEFFAEKENLVKQARPVWKDHEYTDRGKWMDGWESRRRRTAGHDFALIRLGTPGIVRGVVVDTSYFRGNFPESCSIEGTSLPHHASVDDLNNARWSDVLPRAPLKGDSENLFEIDSPYAFSHLGFSIFPDGGVARLRVHGEVVPDWHRAGGLAGEVDLAAIENGAQVLNCSDMFFGPKHNLIMPGRAHNMSDGWETRRRRGPGNDWVIVKLATEGLARRLEIDTNHFKGNYPDTASLEGSSDGKSWRELLPRTRMQPHTRHFFVDELADRGPFSQVRLNVFPDGGVSRLRLWGVASEAGRRQEAVRRINAAPDPIAELKACCGSSKWAEAMAAARPFASWDRLTEAGDRAWSSLSPDDWMEAFRAHPRIGAGDSSPSAGLGMTRGWSAQEQAGARDANRETLADANRAYEQKFGHIFLICATGRSAQDILDNLRARMNNDSKTELRVAGEEQRKITALRLEKLVT